MTMGPDDSSAHNAATARHPLSIQRAESDRPATDPSSSSSGSSSGFGSGGGGHRHRHDHDYHDPSPNDLSLLAGAVLLTADCMGTGILALPYDVVRVLGRGWGVGFVLANLPINLYAGTMLGRCALRVEERAPGRDDAVGDGPAGKIERDEDDDDDDDGGSDGRNRDVDDRGDAPAKNGNERRKRGYSSVVGEDDSPAAGDCGGEMANSRRRRRSDAATFDFVGMASALFDAPVPPDGAEAFDPDGGTAEEEREGGGIGSRERRRRVAYDHPFTRVVLCVYYVNLFLVLGNYILVMSHAVSAMAGEDNLCVPAAGAIASTLMFALSQLRTMANLGRGVSVTSLAALLIVVLQCLHALRDAEGSDVAAGSNAIEEEEPNEYESYAAGETALSKMSSLAAICFAVGSQKLLLNVRHEMADRTKAAPGALSIALSAYGTAYVAVCLAAGPSPPSFLFDAVPPGPGRRVGGFLLWVHVAVSYAINSQAFCSSVDRMVGHRVKVCGLDERHRVRWGMLTASVALLSYLIANGIPFFKDLVALCGAATSIPLTLLIPAIFYRRVQGVPVLFPTLHSKCSFALVLYSGAFMLIGLVGAIGSIDVDWSNKSGPFACR